jgi:hypothetical protein
MARHPARHRAREHGTGLNLSDATAYASLISVPSTGKTGAVRVVPGDPDGSYLIQKIEGAPGIVGERMPRDRRTVPDAEPDCDHPALDRARCCQQLTAM